MILLDSNIVSVPLSARPDERATEWFDQIEGDRLVTSSIVVMELKAGVAIMSEGKRKHALSRDIDRVVSSLFKDAILPFDDDTAGIYADLLARLRRRGVAIGQSDMMIAATALQHGATLATRNVRHFEPCGVTVVNPFEAP